MNKLTARDKVILCILALIIGVFGCIKLIWMPLNGKIIMMETEKNGLKQTLTDKSPLDQKLKQLHKDNEELVKQISEIKGSETAKTLTKEEFLVFLSDISKKSNSQIIKFNDLGLENDNGLWKETFDFRIRGSLKSINSVCERINMMGIRYSVGSMSLRQNEQYPYLERSFDKFSSLEWYKDPVKPKEKENIDAENKPVETPMQQPLPIPTEKPAEPTIQPTLPPISTPTPAPEATPQPTPDTNNGNITDRLNGLLGVSSIRPYNYKVVFLTNNTNFDSVSDIDSGDVMTLTITVQLIMYEKPVAGRSVIITEEDKKNNAVL